MQEVTHSQLEFLLSNLIDYDYVGVGRDDGKQKGEYSINYRSSNLSPGIYFYSIIADENRLTKKMIIQ